jgi:hypothetical protein
MAQSGYALFALHMSAFDPKRTAKLCMTVAKRALSPVKNSDWAT